METQSKATKPGYKAALLWMERCGNVVRRKTSALIQNDLAALEECLEEEAILISEYTHSRSAARFSLNFSREEQKVESAASSAHLMKMAEDVKAGNRLNAVLVDAGLEFSGTLLRAMHPPITYGQMDCGGTELCSRPGSAIISVQS